MGDDKLTIVGPEPTGTVSKTAHKKINIDALLLMAKYDEDFKEKLLNDRETALTDSGIDFSAGEKMLLNNISDEQLAENILEFRVAGVTKKSLPSWAKAAAVILLLSSLMITSADDAKAGTKDDSNTSGSYKVKVERAPVTMGIPPDPVIPRKHSRTSEIAPKENNYTKITAFTPDMLITLNDIKLNLSSKMKVDDIMKEYDSAESEGSDKLISEIKEKLESGKNINDVIKKYEELIYEQ